jgi:hypothetical protein
MKFTLKNKEFDYDNKKVYSEQVIEELRQEILGIISPSKAQKIDFAFGVLEKEPKPRIKKLTQERR